MNDLKVGDEVTLRCATNWKSPAPPWMFWKRLRGGQPGPGFGEVVVVAEMTVVGAENLPDPTGGDLVMLRFSNHVGWFSCLRFRKVQKHLSQQDIKAWVNQPTDTTPDHLDKGAPVKRKEDAR